MQARIRAGEQVNPKRPADRTASGNLCVRPLVLIWIPIQAAAAASDCSGLLGTALLLTRAVRLIATNVDANICLTFTSVGWLLVVLFCVAKQTEPVFSEAGGSHDRPIPMRFATIRQGNFWLGSFNRTVSVLVYEFAESGF